MVFQKGDERINRAGRPVGSKTLTTRVREALQRLDKTSGFEMTQEEMLVDSIIDKAIIDKDLASQKLIWNYLDGMPAQSMDVTTQGQPIIQLSEDVANRYALTPNPEDSSTESEQI